MDRKDKAIKSTDLDALASRLAANIYLDDPLIQPMCEGVRKYLPLSARINMSIHRSLKSHFSHAKSPIIKRGTYIRTRAIDMVVSAFLKGPGAKQIVSIGAGSDTRFLNVLASQDLLVVHEFDFEESVKVKKLAILSDARLKLSVGYDGGCPEIASYDDFQALELSLLTNRYKLMPVDLRDPSSFASLFGNIDNSVPTLVLSECVLCYMSIEQSSEVLNYFAGALKSGMFVVYEPLGGDDNFSQVMELNLASRGIEIPSLRHFKTLESQVSRYSGVCRVHTIQVSDLDYVSKHWIDAAEWLRVSRLEFLDEWEELRLINQHYCLSVVQWGEMGVDLGREFQISKHMRD